MSNDELIEAQDDFLEAASYLMNEFGLTKEQLISLLENEDGYFMEDDEGDIE